MGILTGIVDLVRSMFSPEPEVQVYEDWRFRMAIINLIEEMREAEGVEPLRVDQKLSIEAEAFALSMGYAGDMRGGICFRRVSAFIDFTPADGGDKEGLGSPRSIVTSWMHSGAARGTILSPIFKKIGVGLARTIRGQIYLTVEFRSF